MGDAVGVLAFAKEDATSSTLYMQNVDMVREFRQRHWNFTKEYIIKYSDHAVGTGGSPIVTWLPNQLAAVMKIITDVGHAVDHSQLDEEHKKIYDGVMNT